VTEGTKERHRVIGGMSTRTASWLAWSLWGLSLTLTVLALLILALNLSHPHTHTFDDWLDSTSPASKSFSPCSEPYLPECVER
jgi:hypothetical protein